MANRPIFYDTETTGVRENDFIIELAAYDPTLDKTFEKLIRPPIPIPADATAIHKITDDMVASAPPFREVMEQFCTFCSGDVILVAHNNDSFDRPFLEREMGRNQQTLPPWKFVDSLKWARKYRKDLPRHSLQFLREVYGFAANNAHRALDDVIILHQVFQAMTDDLSIDQVHNLLYAPQILRHMPFGKYQGLPLAKIPANYLQWLAQSGALDKPENESLQMSLLHLNLINQ